MIDFARMNDVQDIQVCRKYIRQCDGNRSSMSSLGRAVGSVKNPLNLQGSWTQDFYVRPNGKHRLARMTQYPFGGGTENEALNRASAMGSQDDESGAPTVRQNWYRLARVTFEQYRFSGSPACGKCVCRQR